MKVSKKFDGNCPGRVIKFPRDKVIPNLDMLITVEPDVILVDSLTHRYHLQPLPFDSIEIGEIEARTFLLTLTGHTKAEYTTALLKFNREAMATAIQLCRQARETHKHAATLEMATDIVPAVESNDSHRATNLSKIAHRNAAILILEATAAAHRARGIDAVISAAIQGHVILGCFGLIDFVRPSDI